MAMPGLWPVRVPAGRIQICVVLQPVSAYDEQGSSNEEENMRKAVEPPPPMGLHGWELRVAHQTSHAGERWVIEVEDDKGKKHFGSRIFGHPATFDNREDAIAEALRLAFPWTTVDYVDWWEEWNARRNEAL